MREIILTLIIGVLGIINGLIVGKGVFYSMQDDSTKFSWKATIVFVLIGVIMVILSLYQTKEIRARKQWDNKITVMMLKELSVRIESFFNEVDASIVRSIEAKEILTEDEMTEICKNCKLDSYSGSVKVISYSPFKTAKTTVREGLLGRWTWIPTRISEIESATSFIHPKAFELVLRIKRASLSQSISILDRPSRNKNFEAWATQVYELYLLDIELKEMIYETEKNNR